MKKNSFLIFLILFSLGFIAGILTTFIIIVLGHLLINKIKKRRKVKQ
jgi:capsular polysaccharide biosynthesis protein